jgi:hypothetical protein
LSVSKQFCVGLQARNSDRFAVISTVRVGRGYGGLKFDDNLTESAGFDESMCICDVGV